MTLQEFAALKVGDKISNPFTFSKGEITEVTNIGVHVVWGARSAVERPFLYGVQSTAWMQWVRDGEGSDAATDSGNT